MTRLRATRTAALAALTVFAALLAAGGSARAAGNVCPSSNAPNTLVLVAGSSQTAKLEAPFQTNLQVALANTNGCPLTGSLAGISVDFVAPAGGASGTFASSGSNVAVVGTDASGTAMAPQFTANDTVGSYTVYAESDYGTVKLYLGNTASGVVASVAASAGSNQEAAVGSQFAQPLQALVLDANGHPVQGASVAFSVGTGSTGASASFLGGGPQVTVLTNAAGQAIAPPLVANAVPGRFTATASTSGIAPYVTTFGLVNHAASSTIAAATTELDPETVVRTAFDLPLQARVLDPSGQPVEGAPVTFALPAGGSGAGATFLGGTSQATSLTDATGMATSPPLVANATAGTFTATAASTIAPQPVTFILRNVAGAPAKLSIGAASGQSTAVATRFPIRLGVTVTDADGNPVAGAVVVFTAPPRGPSGRFGRRPHRSRSARVTTDANGVAVAPGFTAGKKPGGYAVTATVTGSSLHAAFALVNERRG